VNSGTVAIHASLVTLGRALGFHVEHEVSNSLLAVRLDAAYQPRIDLLWSLPLAEHQRAALAWALDRDLTGISHLPVVGIEVEGTTPTTKTMEADLANLTALGAPLGLLVVSEAGEAGIYRRAARAIRTVRRAFGDISVLPVDASCIERLCAEVWPTGTTSPPPAVRTAPRGGETLDWSRSARQAVRQKGEAGGFVAVEPYRPAVLPATFSWLRDRWRESPTQTIEPVVGHRTAITHAGQYLTASEVDLAWLLPLPAVLPALLRRLEALDPTLREYGLVFSELWDHCTAVAFEFEAGSGKHAGGGLLNLAAYSLLGLAVVPTAATGRIVEAALRTYRPTLGLRNVFVRVLPP